MEQTAKVVRQSRISIIWAVPALALLIGLWMIYQYQMAKGVNISVLATSADGIVVGKTELRVRSVSVGVVKQVSLTPAHDKVVITAQIYPRYTQLLRADTKIWVVKPRIDLTGVSGLGTLLSGVYMEVQPGQSENFSDKFALLSRPPPISNDVEGSRYQLNSFETNVLDIGTGIFYHNYQVGQIETARFDMEAQAMRYGIFVYAPYDDLVTDNVLFWQKSGVEFDLSADGIKVNTGSLSQVLQGGIAFRVPEREQAGKKAAELSEYTLSASYQGALEQRFDLYDYLLLNFEQSIRGLKPGAPVEYRGIRIGTVAESPARLDATQKPIFPSVDTAGVPVLVRVEYKRLYHNANQAKKYWQDNMADWIEQGMRASIKPGNLLTGANYIDLDIYPDSEARTMATLAGYQTFPTVSSGFTQLSNQVSSVLNKMNNLDIESNLSAFYETVSSIKSLSDNVNTLVLDDDSQQLPSDLLAVLDSLQASMDGFDATMKNYDANSQFMVDVQQVLNELKAITQQVKPVVRGLNQQPNMLIFDKRLAPDIVPPKGN